MHENIERIFLAAFFFPAVAVVLVFFIKNVSATLQARARLAQDEAYREIAAKAVTSQADTVAVLTDMQSRLAAIEKILKDVE